MCPQRFTALVLSLIAVSLLARCSTLHEKKIHAIYDAAREDNFTRFAELVNFEPERTKSLFESMRGMSRDKNRVKISQPGLESFDPAARPIVCARAFFYYDSLWDFRLLKFPDGSNLYFVFRYTSADEVTLLDIIWGSRTDLGSALASLGTMHSGTPKSGGNAFDICTQLNQN